MEKSSIERAIAQAQKDQEEHFKLLRDYASATEAVARAEDAQVDAWRAAIKHGWTASQIRKIGLPEPRRKRRHSQQKADATTPQSPERSETSAAQ